MQIHLIAIGGSAMHNLARALHEAGHRVTGSDDEIFEPSRSRLAEYDLLPSSMGWDASRIHADLDAVIVGMHAREDNPELLSAQEMGLSIYSYPEYLYEASKGKTRVVVAGSHGKTTITSMILHVLHYHDRDEDYMVGAQLEGFSTMVKMSEESTFMILEGDEYLSSPIDRRPKFHLYHPNITVISGIAWDHINVFPTFENYVEQFSKYLDGVEEGGMVIYNREDEVLANLVENHGGDYKMQSYGYPEYQVEDNQTYLYTEIGEVPLSIFGKHNLLNLEGARLICQQMGIMDDDFYEAIQSFTGASKRLELIAEKGGKAAYKDFAHAPSKVKATVTSTAEAKPDSKLVACLELHTFSSLNPEFLPQYNGALADADVAIVYFNHEAVAHKKLPDLSIESVAKAFGEGVEVYDEVETVWKRLSEESSDPSTLLLMSSGNFHGQSLDEWGKNWVEL